MELSTNSIFLAIQSYARQDSSIRELREASHQVTKRNRKSRHSRELTEAQQQLVLENILNDETARDPNAVIVYNDETPVAITETFGTKSTPSNREPTLPQVVQQLRRTPARGRFGADKKASL